MAEGCGNYTYEDNLNVRLKKVSEASVKPCYLLELPKIIRVQAVLMREEQKITYHTIDIFLI